jgi:hypothetical protein
MVTLQGSAVPRPVTAAPVDALARQLAADDLVGSELVPGRAVRRVTLDDDGRASGGATRRRRWPARHLGLVPFVAWFGAAARLGAALMAEGGLRTGARTIHRDAPVSTRADRDRIWGE